VKKKHQKIKRKIKRKMKKQLHKMLLIKVCKTKHIKLNLFDKFILAAAVLGIAMIAMGEEIGSEMALRSFGHLVRFFVF
jgi:hypothetical protein